MRKEKVLRSVSIGQNTTPQVKNNEVDILVEKLKNRTLDFSEIEKSKYVNSKLNYSNFGINVDNPRWKAKLKEYVNFYLKRGELSKLQ